MRLSPSVLLTCLALLPAISAADNEIPLNHRSVLEFATPAQGSMILASFDTYTSRMSEFDRMLRLKSMKRVPFTRYQRHVAANTLEWTRSELTRLSKLARAIAIKLGDSRLPLPDRVLLVKTTGREEVGQGHTRANAIMLPRQSLNLNDGELLFLLAHELFHVMTRHHPGFRRAAYALTGFEIAPEVRLPDTVAPLQITNPDAPRHDTTINVIFEGETLRVMPVLLSRSAVFDVEIGDSLKKYWTLRLMVVDRIHAGSPLVPRLRNGAPILLRIDQVTGFFEKVGRNTRYVIHAEEIMAEHFAYLVTGEIVPEPERIDALRELIFNTDWTRLPVEPDRHNAN